MVNGLASGKIFTGNNGFYPTMGILAWTKSGNWEWAKIGVFVFVYIYIWSRPPSLHPPPHGLGPQVAAPIPFYLQAIGSISEVQLRIC